MDVPDNLKIFRGQCHSSWIFISYIGKGTTWRLTRRRLIHTIFLWGLLVVMSARSGLEAWMHWSCIDVIVLGFKSVEELYPSPPLGVDSADTSQLPKKKKSAWRIPILPNNPARQ